MNAYNAKVEIKTGTDIHRLKLKHIRYLTENTFVMQFERDGFRFKAGQYISLGYPGSEVNKEYTIYSGENDEYLEIIVREIIGGDMSQLLKSGKPGQLFEINGPYGMLKVSDDDKYRARFILVATGTGIAPFHSFIKSCPDLDYKLVHGIRSFSEAYDSCDYDKGRYISCTSGDNLGSFHGRVTNYLDNMELTNRDLFYLCGNNNMITDAYNILINRDIEETRIFSEIYF